MPALLYWRNGDSTTKVLGVHELEHPEDFKNPRTLAEINQDLHNNAVGKLIYERAKSGGHDLLWLAQQCYEVCRSDVNLSILRPEQELYKQGRVAPNLEKYTERAKASNTPTLFVPEEFWRSDRGITLESLHPENRDAATSSENNECYRNWDGMDLNR